MRSLFPLSFVIVITFFCASCVGTKKFKALEEEKLKLEKTLLSTKQELSEAKRGLNKLKDVSSSTSGEQTGIINNLTTQLEENQAALDASQAATVACQRQLQQSNAKLTEVQEGNKKQLVPFQNVQKQLKQQNRALQAIHKDIKSSLAANPALQLTALLDQDALTLTFDHRYLFSSSGRSLSSTGRSGLYQLAEILKQYPSIYIDILGHVPIGADSKDNWKNSTRKTLSVLYTLLQKEVLPDRIKVIGYGEYQPLNKEDTPEAKLQNSRTELILHYQSKALLKLIPIK